MSLLDRYLEDPGLREIDRVPVAADPERAWAVAAHFDAFRIPFVKLLFRMRAIPDRLRGRSAELPSLRVDTIPRTGPGFIVLEEEPGRELVVGAVGKVWKPEIEFATITPEGFATFDQPGWV